MSEHTKTLPALLAILIGITTTLITGNPVGLFMFGFIAYVQYRQRNEVLHQVTKFMFVASAGICGGLALKGILLGLHPVALLCSLMCAFCASVLYTRMKI